MAEQWIEVGSGITNPTPNSSVDVLVGPPEPICPNMTDSEFGTMILRLRDQAVSFVDLRLKGLARWNKDDQARVVTWFGVSNDDIRARLTSGLTAVARVLRGLTAKNFVRYSEGTVRHLGCLPNPKFPQHVVAEVCQPDTSTHTICLHANFCSMRPMSYGKDSMVSTIIHECTHFMDTFHTQDHQYFMSQCLLFAKSNPTLAIDNADSIAGYVVYED